MTPPILIVGFHRSGTSAIARVLHRSGLHLGDDLLGAEPTNPHGHFEDLEVVSFHDAALAVQGLSWKSTEPLSRPIESSVELAIDTLTESRSARNHPWGIKDPRICLFLPEWLRAAPDARIVLAIRRPGDVIGSLHHRHARRYVDSRGVDESDLEFWRRPDLGLELWLHYHEQILESLPEPSQVQVVDFGDRASVDELPATLIERWGWPLSIPPTSALDPLLGAQNPTPVEVHNVDLLEDAVAMWERLSDWQTNA